jgi:hypothetical protein
MLGVLILTLIVAGLRLNGVTSEIYKSLAHVFIGALVGYTFASVNWVVVTCMVILGAVEIYSLLVTQFPSISLSNLLTLVKSKVTPAPKTPTK